MFKAMGEERTMLILLLILSPVPMHPGIHLHTIPRTAAVEVVKSTVEVTDMDTDMGMLVLVLVLVLGQHQKAKRKRTRPESSKMRLFTSGGRREER